MSDNPYESPESADRRDENGDAENESNREPTASKPLPFPHYLPVVQFSLRLLGVYCLIIGGAGLVEEFYRVFFQIQFMKLEVDFDTVYRSNLISCGVYVVCGLYLILDGTWLIKRVFLPAGTDR